MKTAFTTTRLGLSCLAVSCLASCASSPTWRAPWVYALSRSVYDSEAFGAVSGSLVSGECNGGESYAMVVAFVYVAPFAFDTLFLPVTLPHDVLFVR